MTREGFTQDDLDEAKAVVVLTRIKYNLPESESDCLSSALIAFEATWKKCNELKETVKVLSERLADMAAERDEFEGRLNDIYSVRRRCYDTRSAPVH